MIVSNLQNSSRIEPLHPLFKQLFDYVKSHDLLHTPCGRIELDGDNIYIFFWKGKNVSVGKPLKM